MIIVYIFWYLLSEIALVLLLKRFGKKELEMEKDMIASWLFLSIFPGFRELIFIIFGIILLIIFLISPKIEKLTNWIYE